MQLIKISRRKFVEVLATCPDKVFMTAKVYNSEYTTGHCELNVPNTDHRIFGYIKEITVLKAKDFMKDNYQLILKRPALVKYWQKMNPETWIQSFIIEFKSSLIDSEDWEKMFNEKL